MKRTVRGEKEGLGEKEGKEGSVSAPVTSTAATSAERGERNAGKRIDGKDDGDAVSVVVVGVAAVTRTQQSARVGGRGAA